MEYQIAKERFIQTWGTLGTSWGINRAMAQIHALLLISTEALTTDQIMEELKMSRGNVNMNMRALIDWGIVEKENRIGERKEFFYVDKDIWALARQVSKERKKREVEPVLKVLSQFKEVSGGDPKELRQFQDMTKELYVFTKKVDAMLDKFSKVDQNWFMDLFMKL